MRTFSSGVEKRRRGASLASRAGRCLLGKVRRAIHIGLFYMRIQCQCNVDTSTPARGTRKTRALRRAADTTRLERSIVVASTERTDSK
jgi:hypothetical protein